MKAMAILTVITLLGAVSRAEEGMSDAEMRRRIERSACIFDNPGVASAEIRYVLRCCGTNTNRFFAAMEAVAESRPELSNYICQEIGKFGDPACLPFLYQNLTNSLAGESAALSVLKIEGLTSNSIEKIGMYLSCQSADQMDRGLVCGKMVSLAAQNCITNELGRFAMEKAVCFVQNNSDFTRSWDKVLCKKCPQYRNSKRRLSALRAAVERGIHRNQIAYVTNAINELVAYPEADLPE